MSRTSFIVIEVGVLVVVAVGSLEPLLQAEMVNSKASGVGAPVGSALGVQQLQPFQSLSEGTNFYDCDGNINDIAGTNSQ